MASDYILCYNTWDMQKEALDSVIIPTYNRGHLFLDAVQSVIKLIKEVGSKATIVIKSTVPVGYTERIVKEFDLDNLLFSPEFLREGHALYDNLYPSRIVVSYPKNFPALKEKASQFASLLLQGGEKKRCSCFNSKLY